MKRAKEYQENHRISRKRNGRGMERNSGSTAVSGESFQSKAVVSTCAAHCYDKKCPRILLAVTVRYSSGN